MTIQPARRRYVICLRNEGADDLDVRKVYEVIPDETSARHGLLRVVDESGEDYLYPSEFFTPVEVPEEAEQVLASGRSAAGFRRR